MEMSAVRPVHGMVSAPTRITGCLLQYFRQCMAEGTEGHRCIVAAEFPRPHDPIGAHARCPFHKEAVPDWDQYQHLDHCKYQPPPVDDTDSDEPDAGWRAGAASVASSVPPSPQSPATPSTMETCSSSGSEEDPPFNPKFHGFMANLLGGALANGVVAGDTYALSNAIAMLCGFIMLTDEGFKYAKDREAEREQDHPSDETTGSDNTTL
ncbi:hypothetical protein BKA63DRAFT_573077 [Paraphoma chrysanthemicola]|nr:hypothetical protein BKA63DRAFT_573077 [Paraphoma chrysanthemicola]